MTKDKLYRVGNKFPHDGLTVRAGSPQVTKKLTGWKIDDCWAREISPLSRYEQEGRLTRDDLLDLRLKNKCKECGGHLEVLYDLEKHLAYLQCKSNPNHEGIEREASRYEKGGLSELNILKRREIMEQEYGPEKTKALAKYMGVVSLSKAQALEILVAVYPDAPDSEITRAVMLCASYGLNPLMKHVFLIPFNKGKQNESWATVIGIKAKRLLASRRGNYSYIDDTPRIMTKQEQEAIFGEVYDDKINVITKLKDPSTGAEAPGYGAWPKDSEPYGTEKGNSKFNMAAIRSESQALDRLRPGEMPVGIDVVPEEVADDAIEGEYREVKEEPKRGEATFTKPKEHWCEEHNCPYELKQGKFGPFYAHKKPEGGWCNEKKKRDAAPNPELKQVLSPPKTEEPSPNTIEYLRETMQLCNWSAADTGLFCNTEKGWDIRDFKDLKPEQISEAIDHIKKNPK